MKYHTINVTLNFIIRDYFYPTKKIINPNYARVMPYHLRKTKPAHALKFLFLFFPCDIPRNSYVQIRESTFESFNLFFTCDFIQCF